MKNRLGICFAAAGMVFGFVIIILGFVAKDLGSYAEYASFGGDFYTYSYRATRYAANNLIDVIDAVGYVIISMGLFDIAYFGCKLAGFVHKVADDSIGALETETGDAEAFPEAEASVWPETDETENINELAE